MLGTVTRASCRFTWLVALVIVMHLAGCSVIRQPPQPSPQSHGVEDTASPSRFRLTANVRKKVPSHTRVWRPDLLVLPHAEIGLDKIKIYNIRDCHYRTEENYDVRHFDREFALRDVQSVDFIVVPFQNAPLLAHTMLSFGLTNGEQIVVSVEARLEQGESYSAIAGALKDFELIYVVGTERDLIRLRTEVRKVDVYLYRTRVTPEQAQRLLLAMLGRVNELARRPEFYDVITNNCTTNIVQHINELRPGTVPQDIRVLLPGHSDRLAYDLGLLAAQGPFEQIKASSKINLVARLHDDAADFSARLRGSSWR